VCEAIEFEQILFEFGDAIEVFEQLFEGIENLSELIVSLGESCGLVGEVGIGAESRPPPVILRQSPSGSRKLPRLVLPRVSAGPERQHHNCQNRE